MNILEHYEKSLKRVWELHSNKVNIKFYSKKNNQSEFDLG
jgi:hypothetical protein